MDIIQGLRVLKTYKGKRICRIENVNQYIYPSAITG